MADELKKLLENDVLSDEVKTSIVEAWDEKVQEVKEEVAAEIRNEFAIKFNKEKSEIVEAMNLMIQDILTPMLEELNTEKNAVVAEQIRLKKEIHENTKTFESFCNKVLKEEVEEFRQDRKAVAEGFSKMDSFIKNQVQTVLEDLHNEKQMLAEQKVQVKVNAVKELKETKAKLVREQAKIASKFLEKIITEEMTQLKDELQKAKENNFGRKIFEAYFAEYATTFFNEKEEVKKLQSKIQEGEAKLAEAKEEIEKQGKLISESQNKIREFQDKLERTNVLNDLLRSLSGEKRAIMSEMLEKHPTSKLHENFERYLPVIMEETNAVRSKVGSDNRQNLTEITGDRKNIISEEVSKREKRIISEFVNSSKRLDSKFSGA